MWPKIVSKSNSLVQYKKNGVNYKKSGNYKLYNGLICISLLKKEIPHDGLLIKEFELYLDQTLQLLHWIKTFTQEISF